MTRAGFQPELPPWLADVIDSCGRLFGMRASPRLLLYVCALQACAPSNAPCVHAPSAYARWQGVVLLLSMLQQIGRAECAVAMDHAGPIEVDCSTCRRHGLTSRGVFVYGGSARPPPQRARSARVATRHRLPRRSAAVIGMGAIAVLRRDQNMLWYYGSIMLFFAFVIGLTALLTALETPVLEVRPPCLSRSRLDLGSISAWLLRWRSRACPLTIARASRWRLL